MHLAFCVLLLTVLLNTATAERAVVMMPAYTLAAAALALDGWHASSLLASVAGGGALGGLGLGLRERRREGRLLVHKHRIMKLQTV